MEELMAPEMMAPHPQYRISDEAGRRVYDGWDAVRGLYEGMKSIGATFFRKMEESIAVADWGFSNEQFYFQYMSGAEARRRGCDIDDVEATYAAGRWTSMHWHYTPDARLIGEHIFKAPFEVVQKVPGDQLLTLAEVRETLAPIIAKGSLRPS